MSKERLIELIREATESTWTFSDLADYLLANGVVVPPCKVGDKVYWYNMGGNICEAEVVLVGFVAKTKGFEYDIDFNEIGKTVFLTREEAEAKLKEGAE